MDPSLRHTCNLLPSRDSNPGPVFPIPGFKTEDFVILELSDHAKNMGFTTIKPIMRAVCSLQGGPKKLYIFQHTISLEPFKIK